MASGDLFELVVVGRLANQQVLSTFGFAQVGTPAGDPQATLASNWQTALMTPWRNVVDQNYTVTGLWVNAIYPTGPARYELAISPPLAGNLTGECLPPQSAAVITWRTTLAGRSYRGRTYVPAIPEALQNTGTLDNGHITNLQNFVNAHVGAFITNAATNFFRSVIISRYNNKSLRPNPIGTNVLTGVPRQYVYNQKRRTIGYGS